jgi:hypothetical protein
MRRVPVCSLRLQVHELTTSYLPAKVVTRVVSLSATARLSDNRSCHSLDCTLAPAAIGFYLIRFWESHIRGGKAARIAQDNR